MTDSSQIKQAISDLSEIEIEADFIKQLSGGINSLVLLVNIEGE